MASRMHCEHIFKLLKEKDWNPELYVQQSQFSKMNKKLRPQDKQKLRKKITSSRYAWKEILNGVLKANMKKQ